MENDTSLGYTPGIIPYHENIDKITPEPKLDQGTFMRCHSAPASPIFLKAEVGSISSTNEKYCEQKKNET